MMDTSGSYSSTHVLQLLQSHANPRNVQGMAHFGITSAKALGVPTPVVRSIARKIGTNHRLALQLWSTGILEARAVASLIGDPAKVTMPLMEKWVKEFDNWAICDGVCGNLFDKTPFAYTMPKRWTRRKEEFVRRAGFALIAELAVHDKEEGDFRFLQFLPLIVRGAADERNFVKKAVNWALRQIGKRSLGLNAAAIRTARRIHLLQSSSAKWIASDALRELRSPVVQKRLRQKQQRQR